MVSFDRSSLEREARRFFSVAHPVKALSSLPAPTFFIDWQFRMQLTKKQRTQLYLRLFFYIMQGLIKLEPIPNEAVIFFSILMVLVLSMLPYFRHLCEQSYIDIRIFLRLKVLPIEHNSRQYIQYCQLYVHV